MPTATEERDQLQAEEATPLTLVTSNWATIAKLAKTDVPLEVQPIRISVGIPRYYGAWARSVPCVNALAPWGLIGGKAAPKSKRGFKSRYIERLEEAGVEEIRKQLAEAADQSGRPLALLCYENLDKSWCHRRMFAAWWQEQTGEKVPEFKPT